MTAPRCQRRTRGAFFVYLLYPPAKRHTRGWKHRGWGRIVGATARSIFPVHSTGNPGPCSEATGLDRSARAAKDEPARRYLMLVLTRKVGEQIVIDDNIRVTVLAINGHSIRLGFTAPPDVSIFRQELCEPMVPAPIADSAAPVRG